MAISLIGSASSQTHCSLPLQEYMEESLVLDIHCDDGKIYSFDCPYSMSVRELREDVCSHRNAQQTHVHYNHLDCSIGIQTVGEDTPLSVLASKTIIVPKYLRMCEEKGMLLR